MANSYSRGDRELEKATAMLFPSEIARPTRISGTTAGGSAQLDDHLERFVIFGSLCLGGIRGPDAGETGERERGHRQANSYRVVIEVGLVRRRGD